MYYNKISSHKEKQTQKKKKQKLGIPSEIEIPELWPQVF